MARASPCRYDGAVQVSQVAYDRFVLELPAADADWRPLADPETVAEAAVWLWDFGPTPLVALVGHDGATPTWLAGWATRPMAWGGRDAAAVVIATKDELERFLTAGAPHEHTTLLWPRISPAKTFEALAAPGPAWVAAVEAHARVSRSGEIVEVVQVGSA